MSIYRIFRIAAFAIFFFIILIFLGRYYAAHQVPVPFWDWGACPNCVIGQELVAQSAARGFEQPSLNPVPLPDMTVQAHEVVEVLDTLLLVKRPGRAVMNQAKEIAGANVEKGSEVYVLSSFQECMKVWFINPVWRRPLTDREMKPPYRDFDVCPFEAEIREVPEQDWWLRVRTRAGMETWLLNPEMSDTDYELLAVLEAEPHVLADKLAAVDALLAKGVDLNGPGGKHVRHAPEIVIETFDIEFVREMKRRGMRVEDGVRCGDLYGTILSNRQGFEFFDRLLAEGDLDHCKNSSTSMMGLLFGVDLPYYDVDLAIRSLVKLRQAGFGLNLRGPGGDTVTGRLGKIIRERQSKAPGLERLLAKLRELGGRE